MKERQGLIICLILLAAFALLPTAETQTNTKGVYFNATAPASCTRGELWCDTDTGEFYTCTATNTWTELSASLPQALDTTDTPVFAALGLGVSATSSGLNHIMGTGSGSARMLGVASKNVTPVGNVDGGEDNLMTYSLPANALSADGMGIEVISFGTFAANGNNKTVTQYFGSTALATDASATSAGRWYSQFFIIRTGATAQIGSGVIDLRNGAGDYDGDNRQYAAPAETLSGAVTVKLTGVATATNDIVQTAMIVKFFN